MEKNHKRGTRSKQQMILIVIIIILILSISTIIINAIPNNKTKEVSYVSNENILENNENIENIESENIIAENEINVIEENLIIEEVNKIEEPPAKNVGGTRHRLEVNCEQNVVNVYEKDENGEYKNCVKAMLCSIGSATPMSGTYSLKNYGGRDWAWKGLQGDVFGQYATQITGNILFHSVPYTKRGDNSSLEYWEYDKLGTPASLGCIRLTVKNAKWIYDNCAAGTKVYFYKDSNPGPLGKPSERKISGDSEVNGWDPTDPNSDNPWKEYDIAKKNDKENTESDKNNNIENKIENIEQNTEQNTEISGNTENTETNTEIKGNTEESENSQVGSNTTNSEIENNEVANNNEDND